MHGALMTLLRADLLSAIPYRDAGPMSAGAVASGRSIDVISRRGMTARPRHSPQQEAA
jgi:hypothetical protein